MAHFPETDLTTRIKNTRLPLNHVMLGGSGAIEVVVGSEVRRARDVDLFATEEGYRYARELPGMEESVLGNGNRVVVGNGFEVGLGPWAGRPVEELRARGFSHDGVRVACWQDVAAYKEMRGTAKDHADLKIMRDRLDDPRPLPDAMIESKLSFVRACLPERLRDRPELVAAAGGLLLVDVLFGSLQDKRAAIYAGEVEPGAIAFQHNLEHSAYGVNVGQRNIDKVELRDYAQFVANSGEPNEYVPLFSDDNRVDLAIAYSRHDNDLGHGREEKNPENYDELRSAKRAREAAYYAGVRDEGRLRSIYASVMATTFSQVTSSQKLDESLGYLHMQKHTQDVDLGIFPSPGGIAVSNSMNLMPEDMTRVGAMYPEAPLTSVLTKENVQRRAAGRAALRLQAPLQAMRLIDSYADELIKVITPKGVQVVPLIEGAARHMDSSVLFFRRRKWQTEWHIGSRAVIEQNAQDMRVMAERVRSGESLERLYLERLAYEASQGDPFAVGGLPGSVRIV